MLRCEKCGAKISEGAKRCPACGHKIKKQLNFKMSSIVTCAILIVFSAVIGSIVIYSRISNFMIVKENMRITKTYDSYEDYSGVFKEDALDIEPYKDFFEDTIKKFHNDTYESYHLEEFVVEKGKLVDAYFLEDFVYHNTEMTMALYYEGEHWDLVLQYQSNKSDFPIRNDDIFDVFTQIASLQDNALSQCFALFESDFEDVAYLKTYFIEDGSIKYTYFDQVTSYELVLPISLD